MKGEDVSNKIKELNKLKEIVCTKKELDEYLAYGILIQIGTSEYKTRTGNDIKVNIIKNVCHRFTIDLSKLIDKCDNISNTINEKHIYCMTTKTYNKLKQQDRIIRQDDKEYYIDNLKWYIYKI